MDYSKENQNWDSLSYVEKNHQLYLKQNMIMLSLSWQQIKETEYAEA